MNIFLHTQYGQKRLPMQTRNSRRNSYTSVLFKIHDIRFPSCNFCNLSSERSNDRKRSVALNYAQKLDIRCRMMQRKHSKKRKFEKNVLETKLTTFEKDV